MSPLYEPYEAKKHIENFMHHIQFSGYNQKYRIRVYRGASYRSIDWSRIERVCEEANKENRWYKAEKY